MPDPMLSADPSPDSPGPVSDTHRVFRLTGELDFCTVPELRTVLAALGPGGSVAFDVTDLTFIDAAGLGAIAETAARMDTEIVAPTALVRRAFIIGGLGALLPDG